MQLDAEIQGVSRQLGGDVQQDLQFQLTSRHSKFCFKFTFKKTAGSVSSYFSSVQSLENLQVRC